MSEAEILGLLREFLFAGALMAAPLCIVALLVGLVVGLLQALTSIQEMTLTFVPKIVIMLITFVMTSGYMARIAIDLFDSRVITTIATR